jgi:hypothetical protein
MYQTIDETIEVVGIYRKPGFEPVKFKWQSKVYAIDEITFKAAVKDGGVRGWTYSVVSQGTLFRLYFNREDEHWKLKETWIEG